MKLIKNIGLLICITGFSFFIGSIFIGEYHLSQEKFDNWINNKGIKSEIFIADASNQLVGKTFSAFALSSKLIKLAEKSSEIHQTNIQKWQTEGGQDEKINKEWSKVIWIDWSKVHKDFTFPLLQATINSSAKNNQWLAFFLTFGLAIIGGLLYIIPDFILLGPAGIKNNKLFQHSATNRGWGGMLVAAFFIIFYFLLYFFPDFLINPILATNPISLALSGNSASQWFMYGLIYCSVMTVFAVKMYVKYRHNLYQVIRTTVVWFFQIAFAFLIPEMLVRFNQPWYDFKNAWPLNYTFFFDWNINSLLDSGNLGLFMLVWGILLTLVVIPVMVYFLGKRWYCSWVCGCGGLAETLGDPYRHLSDKSLKAWKFERYIIHLVLVFATVMTGATLYTYFSGATTVLGVQTTSLQSWYGFWIGSIFAGVIGTGFYPIMGNRVWCRFGCPLAAYLGLVQKIKSRFRITTNGGQCISCGNCSTYCEMGIDVRSYAQKGQNIVRSSCVGCGVCSAVCPRGVLKLENAPDIDRVNDNPILIGKEKITLNS
ncbi:MAG: 4Fe-4S binding protein [Flavobacteriales bacterium]|nr:4Fe-4S binding protein [Flavobacteriales bacterium]